MLTILKFYVIFFINEIKNKNYKINKNYRVISFHQGIIIIIIMEEIAVEKLEKN